MTQDTVRIRDLVVERGATRRGFLMVGETPMGPIQIPLVIVHGAKAGPTLCLTAGVHAAEYPAIDAVLVLAGRLDPAGLSGTLVAVPVVNSSMFRARSAFTSPIDGLNLNRTFPGKPDGSISEVIAHVLLNEVAALVDFHIDCHGGDLREILWPYSGYFMAGNPAARRREEAMARLYSPRIVALYREGTPCAPPRAPSPPRPPAGDFPRSWASPGAPGAWIPPTSRLTCAASPT